MRVAGRGRQAVGGVLARRWNLPNAVASAIERHHADDAQGDAAFVRLADMLAHYSQGSPVSSTELLRAARNVGEQTPTPCPVCAAGPLVHVTYVFGDALRQANGRVWPRNGLADLHRSMDEVACYVVEVCTACYWNHLAQRYLLGRRHVG